VVLHEVVELVPTVVEVVWDLEPLQVAQDPEVDRSVEEDDEQVELAEEVVQDVVPHQNVAGDSDQILHRDVLEVVLALESVTMVACYEQVTPSEKVVVVQLV